MAHVKGMINFYHFYYFSLLLFTGLMARLSGISSFFLFFNFHFCFGGCGVGGEEYFAFVGFSWVSTLE